MDKIKDLIMRLVYLVHDPMKRNARVPKHAKRTTRSR